MKDHGFENAPDLGKALDRASCKTASRSIEIDVERYQAYLDDPSLSDDRKEITIEAIWTIISAFVELGFDVHPTQQACGKRAKELDPADQVESDMINSEDIGLKEELDEGPKRE